jgi:hypothetical protein
MKRVHDAAWPMIGLGAVAVSSWLLFKDLRGLSFARACVQLARERIGIGRGTLRVSDRRGIPESANV